MKNLLDIATKELQHIQSLYQIIDHLGEDEEIEVSQLLQEDILPDLRRIKWLMFEYGHLWGSHSPVASSASKRET